MKNGSKNSILNHTTKKETILTGLLAVLVLATVLLPIRNLDQITSLGHEIEYWGGAMSLLGQDWAYYMDSNAIVSYGYSLVLLPICMIFQNASLAYKASIVLNGCFWVLAYLCSVTVGRKISKEASPYVSIIGCFLIFLLPIYTGSRALIGPEALLILLFWESVNLVYDLQQDFSSRKFVCLGILMVISVWMEPGMIAAVVGTIIYLYLLMKDEKINEEKLLKWILFVLIGVIAGSFLEQFFTYQLGQSAEMVLKSGMQNLMDQIMANWTNQGIVGIFFSFIGKIFTLSVNTFGLVLPIFAGMIYCLKNSKDERTVEQYINIVFLIVCVTIALCYAGNQGEVYFNFGFCSIVVGPVLLIGINKLLTMDHWMEKAILYIACLFTVTILATYLFKNGGGIIDNIGTGVLSYFNHNMESITGMIYYGAAVTAIVFLLGLVFLRTTGKKTWISIVMAIGSIFVVAVAGTVANKGILLEEVEHKQDANRELHTVSNILDRISGEIYYFQSYHQTDKDIAALQMLTRRKNVQWMQNKDGAQEELCESVRENKKNSLILTAEPYKKWENKMEGYEPVYLTGKIIVWATKESDAFQEIEDILTAKDKKANKTESGRKSSYGKNITLARGTYVARYKLTVQKYNEEKGIGKVLVQDNRGILQLQSLDELNLKPGKETVVEIPFTSDIVMENVQFKVNGNKGSKIQVKQVSYQKKTSTYAIGLDNHPHMKEIYSVIKNTDQELGKRGSILCVDSIYGEKNIQTDMNYLNALFEGYQIDRAQSTENAEYANYLIFETEPREYFDLLGNYSILKMNEAYTLLAKTGSPECIQVEKTQGYLYSEKQKIDIRAFLQSDKDGSYHMTKPFILQGGEYNFIVNIRLLSNSKNKEKLGTISLKNGEKKLAGITLNAEHFQGKDVCEVAIPVVYKSTARKLHVTADMKAGVKVEIEPASVELKSQNYTIGIEENQLSSFANIVNKTDKKAKVSFYVTEQEHDKNLYSFDYLESLMPECDFNTSTYNELMDETGDTFVITSGYSTAYFKMVPKYTIISRAGKYLLWARSDGKYIVDAMDYGATMYSQGNKISPYCLAKVQGINTRNGFSNFYPGKYRIYLNVEIKDARKHDTIEIGLSRDKTQSELNTDVELLEAQGYLEKDIDKLLEKTYYTDTRSYDILEFAEDELITTIDVVCPKGFKNLKPVCYSWKGSKVTAEVAWVELIE